jgi:pyruvate,water dikinase
LLAADTPDPRAAVRAQRAHFEAARDAAVAGLGRRGVDRLLPWRRRLFLALLGQMRALLWWREELRDASTHLYHLIRRHALEVGRRLAGQGVLAAADEVFLLAYPDLVRAMAGALSPAEAAALVRRNRAYLDSFRAYANPNEIGARYGRAPAGRPPTSGLAGIPCSPGAAVGPARQVADVAEVGRLRRGDVLVTRCTDPGWTAAFGLLAAVVTETGGLLSHAAVIAREYGIPAVLAVPDATRRVPDGQALRVDGTQGVVAPLEAA